MLEKVLEFRESNLDQQVEVLADQKKELEQDLLRCERKLKRKRSLEDAIEGLKKKQRSESVCDVAEVQIEEVQATPKVDMEVDLIVPTEAANVIAKSTLPKSATKQVVEAHAKLLETNKEFVNSASELKSVDAREKIKHINSLQSTVLMREQAALEVVHSVRNQEGCKIPKKKKKTPQGKFNKVCPECGVELNNEGNFENHVKNCRERQV